MSMFTFSTAGIMLAVMALTTYAIRVTPMAIFHRKLENRWFKDFMFYIPFCVLAAMTFPDVLYSTGEWRTAVIGAAVAVILAWKGRSLLTVALAACCAVALAQGFLLLI